MLSKRDKARIDAQINTIVNRRCSGLQINILDIGKVFRAGYLAIEAGGDLEAAIVGEYTRLAHKS